MSGVVVASETVTLEDSSGPPFLNIPLLTSASNQKSSGKQENQGKLRRRRFDGTRREVLPRPLLREAHHLDMSLFGRSGHRAGSASSSLLRLLSL